jgi:hypothetical protein
MNYKERNRRIDESVIKFGVILIILLVILLASTSCASQKRVKHTTTVTKHKVYNTGSSTKMFNY